MGDDAAGSRSLFVVLHHGLWSKYLCSIVQLTQPPPEDVKIVDTKYFAHIKLLPPPEGSKHIYWSYVAPPSSNNDLYIVADSFHVGNQPLHCATLSCSTKTFQPMKPHETSSLPRIAVNVGPDIYFLAHPHKYKNYSAPEPAAFERYSPAGGRWYKEEPFPYRGIQQLASSAKIVANAVWDDIIILNMGRRQIWAYHVSKHKWYRVLVGDEKEEIVEYDDDSVDGSDDSVDGSDDSVGSSDDSVDGSDDSVDGSDDSVGSSDDSDMDSDDSDVDSDDGKKNCKDGDGKNNCKDDDSKDGKYNYLCYDIIGEGFVVKNTIYALSNLSFSSVLALSIEKKEVEGGDLKFGCSLRSEIYVPLIKPIEGGFRRSRHFVYLGGENFCLVQSCHFCDPCDYQPIQVTYMKLEGEDKMVVENILEYRLSMPKHQLHGQFHVEFCFSQLECKTTALNQGETTFIFDPYEGFWSEEDKTDFNPLRLREHEVVKQEEEENVTLRGLHDIESTSDEQEGNSIIVMLPGNHLTKKILSRLWSFGAIENLTVKKGQYVLVEYQSAAARALAIQASPIKVFDYLLQVVAAKGDSIIAITTASTGQLVTELLKFGPLKEFSEVQSGDGSFVMVEFASAAARENAIKSPIKISGHLVDIEVVKRGNT